MQNWTRAAAAALMMTVAVPATAAECIAPAHPGGGWDFTCRQIGRIMTELGRVPNMVQVTNLAGAGGGIAYTQVVSNRGTHTTWPPVPPPGSTAKPPEPRALRLALTLANGTRIERGVKLP